MLNVCRSVQDTVKIFRPGKNHSNLYIVTFCMLVYSGPMLCNFGRRKCIVGPCCVILVGENFD